MKRIKKFQKHHITIQKYSQILLCILLSVVSFSQVKNNIKYPFSQKINKDYELVFLRYSRDSNLYSKPRILYKGKLKPISDFEENNYSGIKIRISKNNKYIVIDNITKGYVYTQNDSILSENYACVVIDVRKAKIVHRMQSDCAGKWNKKNQWVNDGIIVF